LINYILLIFGCKYTNKNCKYKDKAQKSYFIISKTMIILFNSTFFD